MSDETRIEQRGQMVQVHRHVSLQEQLKWAQEAAARDRTYWQGQVLKRRAGAAYAAERCLPGSAVVQTLEHHDRSSPPTAARSCFNLPADACR